LVQDAFITKYNRLPSASLVKAILLNSAEDVGIKGIDFLSGYGTLNADAAVKTVAENRLLEDEMVLNQTKSYTFTVPPAIAQLKLTVVWTDTPAVVNAVPALVNDVDAVLKLPSTGEEWLPWVLNPYPLKDSLMLSPLRKKDTLNNVEQISIENPLPGNYVLEIKGSRILGTNQTFSIAYQLDTLTSFQFTYPTASDVPVAGKTNVIRWQSNIIAEGVVEYSRNGTFWQTVTATADLSKPYQKWETPDTTAFFLLRVRIPSQGKTFTSDTFLVSKPINLQVGFNCPDSFLLFWNKQPVNQYQLYSLGTKYLEPILLTGDTIRTFTKAQSPSLYYSVAPVVNNKRGLKSYTINYATQGVGCYLRTFFASLETNKTLLTATLGTTYDVAAVSFQKVTTSGLQLLQTINGPSVISLSVVDPSLTRGLNRYQLAITLKNGNILYSPLETIYYFPDLPVIIYPNPARQSESIKLIVKDPFTYSIEIYDVMGKKIRSKALDGFTTSLEPFVLSKGLYFIKITTQEGKLSTQKLIVQ
jgi:hypothetical protein